AASQGCVPIGGAVGCALGQPHLVMLVVTPQEPVVPYGGSVGLNCSLHACAEGMVQWKGLDTNLGSVTSFPTYSILHISSAVVAMGGTKICQGACQGQYYQRTVNLRVYALPEGLQLEAAPRAPVPGQPLSLCCSAHGVYPHKGLLLTWYRGDQELQVTDPDVTETEEELFDIVATLAVDGKEVEEGTEFRCKVTLSIGSELHPSTALPAEPSIPTHGPSAPQEPDAATERPAPGAATTTGRAHPITTAPLPGPGTAEMQRLDPATGTGPACSLRLWSLPPNGTRGRALRIECRARCPGNATVRWLRTPVALSQYRQEATGSSSTLQLDRAEPRHQGHYQCVLLGHGSHAASLHLAVLDGTWCSADTSCAPHRACSGCSALC
uniref:Ig-like domain-containing protein n=1 Tax=Amazona collaria TaxID=241587 RepID=A0A8B9FR51_9PSIT